MEIVNGGWEGRWKKGSVAAGGDIYDEITKNGERSDVDWSEGFGSQQTAKQTNKQA